MYRLNHDYAGGATAVPTDLIDRHLKLAPAASFKVLLYILRNPEAADSKEQIAACTGLTASDAADSLEYWLRANIIINDDKAAADEAKRRAAANAKTAAVQPAPKTEPAVKRYKANKPTQGEIAKRLSEEPVLTEVFREAQNILGTFGYDTQGALLMIYDYYGLPAEVILTLVQYQKSLGSASTSAILNRAGDWSERGINSLELVQSELKALEKIEEIYKEIRALVGFEQKTPSKKISDSIRRWAFEWDFSTEMILLALGESGKSMGEADKLLKKYMLADIKTPEEAERRKKRSIPEKKEKTGSTFDFGKSSILERAKRLSEAEESESEG